MTKVKYLVVLLVLVCGFLSLSGCTENRRSKLYGMRTDVTLPSKQKLVTVSWKEHNLWYLTRPMRTNEEAETWTFQEKSNLGLVEGSVVLHEQK